MALTAKSVEDIHGLCAKLGQQCNFGHFLYGVQFPTSLVKPHQVTIDNYPKKWLQRYVDEGYVYVDPVLQHCFHKHTPIIWCDVPRSVGEMGRKSTQVMAEARDFGLKSGISIPIHGSQGEVALLSLASDQEQQTRKPQVLESIQKAYLVSAYLHEAVNRLMSNKCMQVGHVKLTGREKECLLWAADGKTAWEISQILEIAERTVIFHLQNCATKLQVSNRPQAIARAISLGLIKADLSAQIFD